jgi:hypothetical protein
MNNISKLANQAAYFFIGTTFFFTIICVGGIWSGFDDTIGKSLASMGLLAVACLVILVVEEYYPKKVISSLVAHEYVQAVENYVKIRKFSFNVIIVSITICVFLGLLSIWELFDEEVFWKSLSTMASIGFYAFITLVVCMKREESIKNYKIEGQNDQPSVSATPPAQVTSSTQSVQQPASQQPEAIQTPQTPQQ